MRKLISLQSEFANFQRRETIYVFALKMGFLTVIGSFAAMLVALPTLSQFDLLAVPMEDAIEFAVILSWVAGIVVAALLSLAIGYSIHEMAVSRDEFERLSRIDPLSGLLNRRAFDEILAGIESEVSLAIFDLDEFKAVNDRYGHAAGDIVITQVAKLLSTAFGEDYVGRLGGEEFGAIVTGGGSMERLERIDIVKSLISANVIAFQGKLISVSVSAGVADAFHGRDNFDLHKAADKALYAAKDRGRNLVVHEAEPLQASPAA